MDSISFDGMAMGQGVPVSSSGFVEPQPAGPLSVPRSSSTPSITSPTQSIQDDGTGMLSGTSTSPTDFSAGAGTPLGPPAVPTACLGCRGKHLKCDGQMPCSRCKQTETECVYIASRRGYKGPRKPNKRLRSSSPPPPSFSSAISAPPPADSCPMMLGRRTVPATTGPMTVVTSSYASPVVVSNGSPSAIFPSTPAYTTVDSVAAATSAAAVFTDANSIAVNSVTALTPSASIAASPAISVSHLNLYRNPFASGLNNVSLNGGGSMALAITQPAVAPIGDRCIDAYYQFFYPGHPFALPKETLLALSKESSTNIDHLLAAMRYVGSLYLDAGPARAMFLDEAVRLAYLPSCPKDGFLVQALILLIIGLDGSCNQERARQILADAERISLEIGLNQRGFAAANGRGNPVFEECWRRTWWDLFVVDGMVAGVHRMTNFFLFDVPADVALPCEEHQYTSGNIPTPMYIEDFDDQLFSGEEREFSSFAYRVAAARILGRFMRCPPILYPEDENLEKIQSLLTNWRMHLPATKRDDLDKDCRLDEMMFQAHFITHACSILLHQPHSQLDSSPTRSVTSCAPHSHVPTGDAFNLHTRHTITAACEISKMVTQAVPLLSHTHFFTCVITLSSIVHLSKWALYFVQDEDDLRQQIRLNIGALNKLSEVWKAANTASGQVRGVAQEIYRAKKAQQINPAFWVGFTQEEMINSLNTDEGIMSEFDNMLPATTQ